MKFHIDLDIKKLSPPITHHSRMLLVGSCFTENIGEKLRQYKFEILENPNGILFNPVSVAETIIACIENKILGIEDLFELNEGWHSWKHHSRFSAVNAQDALEKINASTTNAHHFLKQADVVMITLGSAWVYSLTNKALLYRPGVIAANNHKAPADWFHKKLLTTEAVLQELDQLVHRLFHFNPELRVIFTISPVRHIREGLVDNNRSKAVLIQAVHHLCEKFDRLHYFPAYELVIDDLRDYRFYAEDLVHPNYHATQYVWEKFVKACMDEKTEKLMESIHSINLAYRHKPFNADSKQHQAFLQSFHEKTKALEDQHPYLNFEKELIFFSS